LRQGKVPVTEFRAGVIAGSGSISFEMIRFMTELFPIVPGPRGLKNKTQPIAVQNVIDYLMAALENPNGQGRVFEIGGPEILTYQELMQHYASARGLKRGFLILPYIPLWFMSLGVGLTTPVPRPIAYALIGGLSADSVVKHPEALTMFPEVKLIGFDESTREALDSLSPLRIERVWMSNERVASLKHEGFFILHQKTGMGARPETIFPILERFAQDNNWRVESVEFPHHILLRRRRRAFGDEWLEWRVAQIVRPERSQRGNLRYFLAPRGLLGFLYWHLLYPFHLFNFRRTSRRLS
jgi:hypothetical protein